MPATRTWLKNPLAIFTANALDARGGLVLQDGVIVEVLAAGQQPSAPCTEVFDAREHVILPGLINTHHHFYQTLTRAWAPVVNQPLFPWLKTLYPVWARLTPEKLALATKVALAELLLSGCTTAADHHYLFPNGLENAIDVQVDTVRELGMRAMLTRGSMSLGEKDGGLPPQQTVQEGQVILDDSQRLIHEYHERGDGAQIQIALAPCSPFSVTRKSCRPAPNWRTNSMCACTPIWPKPSTKRISACSVWPAHRGLSGQRRLARPAHLAGPWHSLQPGRNRPPRPGRHRYLPLPEFEHAPGLRHLPEHRSDRCRCAVRSGCGRFSLQRCVEHDPRSAAGVVHPASALRRREDHPERVLGWATKGSASLLGRTDIGELAVGKQADLALFKLDELRFSGSHDPISALLLCGADRADRVMIGGQWRVIDGQVEGLDLKGLIADHSQAARQLIAGT